MKATNPTETKNGGFRLSDFRGLRRKVAFVPSPQTQQRVQQAAQQGQVAQVQQDGNSNAVSPGGITLDDVAGMLEQAHSETMGELLTMKNQMSEMRAALPAPKGEGQGEGHGGGSGQMDNAMQRIAQLEQMISGQAQQAQQPQQAPAPQQ